MLGVFDLAPMHEILGICEIGDGAVMAAGRTKNLAIVGRHEPVADVVLGVAAEAIPLPFRRERTPRAIDRFQCGDDLLLRQITQPQATALTSYSRSRAAVRNSGIRKASWSGGTLMAAANLQPSRLNATSPS